jgi:predicted P-loop ATPase
MLPDLAARINWKGRRVIIAYDADATTSDRVERARARLMYALIELGASVGWIEWPATEGKGIDDRLAQVGPERVLFDIANCEFGGWQSHMVRTKEGALVPCIENVRLFLSNAAEWVGAVGYNEFTGTHVIIRDDNPTTFHAGQEIEDHYDTQVICWLERRHLFTNPATVGRVIDSVAREHAYHPVRHYLESLPAWDGRPRIGSWLLEYCGAEAEDEAMYHYIATIGEKFLISAVARIFEPGCKVDHLLILEGTQGIGKSTVPRILAGDEWFTDQLADLGHKQDAAMALRGRWVIEFGELDVIGRAEMTRVNAFLTQQTDRYRPPYGRHMVEFPRQCVFIGTTNQDAWSRDETGARRFWPVRCGVIDVDGLKRDREQLWAEAIRQYRAGVKWWLEGRDLLREAVNQQEGRYLGDPWQVRVIEHAENLADCVISGSRANSASISEILDKLGIRVGDQDQRMANRVARCLLFAKWVRKRTGSRGDREWRYFRPVMTQAVGAVV